MPIRIRVPLLPWVAVCVAIASLPALAASKADRSDQRQHYRNVLNAIERGPADAWKREVVNLADYPLLPYVELAVLKSGNAKPSLAQVEAFIKRWPDTLIARDLRESMLRQLATSQDWPAFRKLWSASSADDLQCAWQRARIANGETPDYAKEIAGLWMQPRPTPASCDPLFAWARQNGSLTDVTIIAST